MVAGGLVLGELYSDDERAGILGYATAGGGVTAMASVWISGWILDVAGWRDVFWQFTVGGVLALLVGLALKRSAGQAPESAAAAPVRLSSLAPAAPYVAGAALLMFLAASSSTQAPLSIKAAGVYSNGLMANLFAAQSLFTMVGSLSYGRVQGAIGRLPLALVGCLVLVAGCVFYAIGGSGPLYIAGASALGLGTGAVLPLLTDGLFARTPSAALGYAFGLFTSVSFMGGFASPFLMSPVRESVGLPRFFPVLAVITALVCAAFLLTAVRQSSQRRRAELTVAPALGAGE